MIVAYLIYIGFACIAPVVAALCIVRYVKQRPTATGTAASEAAAWWWWGMLLGAYGNRDRSVIHLRWETCRGCRVLNGGVKKLLSR